MARRRRIGYGEKTKEIKIDETWKQTVPERTLNRLLKIVRNWGYTNISTIKQLLKIVEKCVCGRIYTTLSGSGYCPVCACKLMEKKIKEHPNFIGWKYFTAERFERLYQNAKLFKPLWAA